MVQQGVGTKWIDCGKKIFWCDIVGHCGENIWHQHSELWEVMRKFKSNYETRYKEWKKIKCLALQTLELIELIELIEHFELIEPQNQINPLNSLNHLNYSLNPLKL